MSRVRKRRLQTTMPVETKEERGIRHRIADVDEIIRRTHEKIGQLEIEKVELKNQLFVSRHNRGIR